MIIELLIAIIVVIVFLIWYEANGKNKIQNVDQVEELIDMEDVHNKSPMMAPPVNPNFIEAMFHQDYMDVITSFHNISPNQRQIFNINNVPCKVTKETDVKVVGKIVSDFIDVVNQDIAKNVPLYHTPNSGWDETLPEHAEKSGWEKVQESLGLPKSLFNKPVMNTKVKLVNFSEITKYETENEIKYTCKIVIVKDKVKDKLVIKTSFVHPKGLVEQSNIVIEDVAILGFLTNQGLRSDRMPLDNFYYFDNLERNNMISGERVANELMKKYDLRQKVMQERVDGMELDVQEKYAQTPSPVEYDSYKVTQTVIDDILDNTYGKKKFD